MELLGEEHPCVGLLLVQLLQANIFGPLNFYNRIEERQLGWS
jgi:hypothetical protein